MLWSKFIAALVFVPCALAKPIAYRLSAGGHLSDIQRRNAGTGTYTVVSGDTGNTIAAVYSITFSTLSSANPNVNWNSLQIGQSLNMPSARKPIAYTVVSGDTESGIASKYDIYTGDLGSANPNVNWNALPIGTNLRVPGYGSYTTYTVTSGDTGSIIAQAYSISFDSLSAANPNVNWNNLQIGQVLTVPAGTSPGQGTLPSPASSPAPIPTTTTSQQTVTTTTVVAKTTATTSVVKATTTTSASITQATTTKTTSASSLKSTTSTSSPPKATTTSSHSITTSSVSASTTVATGEPTVTPTATVTGSNYVQGGNNNDGVASRADSYTFYQGDGSTADGWPDKSQWLSFSTMWNNISPVLGQSCQSIYSVANNSPQENQYMYDAINAVASNSGVDHRLILSTIIQESSGCVRVKTTVSPDGSVTNPGLMQDYNGSGSCNSNGNIQNPCPASQIYQMVEDGTFGTRSGGSSTYQGGLVQDINGNGGYTGAQAYYRAARIYNSGSVPANNDLGGPGATRCYASDIANRLMGWLNAKKTCTLDG